MTRRRVHRERDRLRRSTLERDGEAEAPAPQWRHVPDAVQAATAQTHADAVFWGDPRRLARAV